MMLWEFAGENRVTKLDWQLYEAAFPYPSGDVAFCIELAACPLDGDLPSRGRADEDEVPAVPDCCPSFRPKPGIVVEPPEKAVRVEQELHYYYSANASKLSGLV